jgi:DNA-binding transcriptional regulator YdaS (Cro superfamily)
MKLKEWKKKTGIEDGWLANKAGVHPSYLSHLRAGRRTPSPDVAAAISAATKGAVGVLDLLYPGKKIKRRGKGL